MGDKLTTKELGFIKDYNKTGNGTQAVLKNYDTKNVKSAGVIAVHKLAKVSVQKRILSIADRLSDDLLLKVHKEGLKATTATTFEGEVIDNVPDYSVRQRYLDTAYKLKGIYAPEKRVSINGFGKLEEMSTEELLKATESIDDSVKEVLE